MHKTHNSMTHTHTHTHHRALSRMCTRLCLLTLIHFSALWDVTVETGDRSDPHPHYTQEHTHLHTHTYTHTDRHTHAAINAFSIHPR